jgi:membrane protease YdiL (CAAX protease family)
MKIARYLLVSLCVVFGLLFAWILLPGFYFAAQDGYLWTKEFAAYVAIYSLGLATCAYTIIRCIEPACELLTDSRGNTALEETTVELSQL